MQNIIAFVNQKGGVGKTASSSNEAYCFSTLGYKTLFGDLCPSASGTKVLGQEFPCTIADVLADRNFDISKAIYPAKLQNKEVIKNLFVLPSHISLALIDSKLATMAHREKLLKNQLEKIQKEFEIIILDLPPLLTSLSSVGIYAADKIIIPIKYEKDALDGVTDLFKQIKEVKESQDFTYMILRNAQNKTKKTMIEIINNILKPFEERGKVFKTIINDCEEINKAKADDCPVLVYSPNSIASEKYLQLANEIKEIFLK